MADDKITLDVGFELDKASLSQIKTELTKLQSLSMGDMQKINGSTGKTAREDLRKISNTAKEVETALAQAFNPKLNTVNLQSFNRSLKQAGLSTKEIYQNFSKAGTLGVTTFRSLANQITTFNKELKQGHKILDKVAETLGNTIKWNIASSAINTLSSNIQQAYGYVKSLDHSLNDIRIVTGKSAESMKDFAVQANDAARSLGTTTTEYTKSALTFYQQGLGDEEANARATLSNKVANVTGLSGDQSAEYVTAVLNGYKVSSEEAEHAMDKLAAVGAATAADLGGLSEAMSKVASSANAMGVSEDQLAATLATVMSITRQSASTIGTAFKTIYARIADINAGADDAEATLGEYTGRMAALGFNVLDSSGKLRDLGEVMEEVGNSWSYLSREQQIALARTMAGTRQYNNLIALFDNWDDYVNSLNVSLEANGTLQAQQIVYMQSTAAHLNVLKASLENVYDSFLGAEDINNVADGFSRIADVLASFLDSIGGGTALLRNLGAVAIAVFSNQIGKSLNTTIQNFFVAKNNLEDMKNILETIQKYRGIPGLDSATDKLLEMKQSLLVLSKYVSPETFTQLKEEFNQLAQSMNVVDELNNDKVALDNFLSRIEGEKITLDLIHSGVNTEDIQDRVGNHFNAIENTFSNAKGQVAEITSLLNGWKGKGLEGFNGFNEASQKTNNLIDTLKLLNKQGLLSEDMLKKLEAQATRTTPEKWSNLSAKQKRQNFEPQIQKFISLIKQIDVALDGADKSASEFMTKINQEFDNLPDSVSNALTKAEENFKKTGQSIEQSLKNITREELISNITRAVGGLTSMAMSIQTLQNLGSIWNNDDLSDGEKVLQLILNLSMGLPMLVQGATAITAGIQGISHAKKTFSAATAVASAVIDKETASEIGNAAAKGGNKIATDTLTTSQLGLNAAMLANPLTWIIALLGAAVAATLIYSKAQKQAIENQIKANKELIKSAIERQEENKELEKSFRAYQNLYDMYEKTGEASDDFKKSTLELADALGVQVSAVDLLSEKYDKINKDIIKAKNLQAKSAYEDAKGAQGLAQTTFGIEATSDDPFLSGRKDIVFDPGYFERGSKNTREAQDYVWKYIKDFYNQSEKAFSVYQTELSYDNTIPIPIYDTRYLGGIATDQLSDYYEAIQQAYIDIHNDSKNTHIAQSKYIQAMGDWLDENKESYENLKKLKTATVDAAKAYAQTQTADLIDETKINSYEDYKKYKEEYKKQLLDLLGGENEVEKIYDRNLYKNTDEYLEYLTNAYFKGIDRIKEYVQSAEIEEELFKALTAYENPNLDLEKKANIKNFLSSLNAQDLQLIAKIGFDETASINEIRAILKVAKAEVKNTFNSTVAEATTTIIELNNTGKKLTKEQIKQLDLAKQTVNAYLQVQESINGSASAVEEWNTLENEGTLAQAAYMQTLLLNDGKIGNLTEEEYRAGLEAKRELYLEESKRLQGLAEDIERQRDNIRKYEEAKKANPDNPDTSNLIIKTEEDYQKAQSAVEEYNNALIENTRLTEENNKALEGNLNTETIKQNISNLQKYGESTIAFSKQVNSVLKLVEDNFTIKPENVDAIAKAIPELLVGQEVLADGTIQLDKKRTEEILNNEKKIRDAHIDTAASAMKLKILEAQTEQERAQLRISMGEALIELSKEDYLNQEMIAEKLQSLGMETADAYATAADLMTENSTNFFNHIIDCIDKLIKASQEGKEAFEAMLDETKTYTGTELERVGAGPEMKKPDNEDIYSHPQILLSDILGGTDFKETDFTAQQKQSLLDAFQAQNYAVINELLQLGDEGGTQAKIAYSHAVQSARARESSADLGQYLIQTGKHDLSFAEQNEALLQAELSKILASRTEGFGKDKSGNKNDHIDLLEKEKNLYHEIDLKIKQLDRDLSRLKKEQKTLYGQDLMNNLNKQLGVLNKQRDAYKKKIDLAKQEAKVLKTSLSDKGVQFDSQGYVSNYAQALQAKLDYVNSLIIKYNAMSESEQKIFKEVVEEAKKDYENFKKELDNYNTIVEETIPDLEEQIEDSLYEQVSIQLEKFDMKIQFHLDMAEAQRDWNQFKRKVIDDLDDDDLFGKAKQAYDDILSYYSGPSGIGSIQAETEHLNKVMSEVRKLQSGGHSSIYSAYDSNTGKWVDDTKSAMEDLKEHSKSLMEQLEAIKDLEEQVRQAFLDSIDAVQEAYNQQKGAFEFLGAQIDHDVNLTKLLYGDEAYSRMDKYFDRQIRNIQDTFNAQEKAKAYWKAKMDAEQALVNSGMGDKDALAKYTENWKEAVSNVNSLIEQWAEQLTNKYENTVDMLVKSLEDKLTNGLGLEHLDKEQSLTKMVDDNYLDEVNRMYSIQKLANKWQDAIDNTDSVTVQQELNSLMEEQLKMLEEKGKLTQHDIERAEKEYDIALKQIALKEAQQNKSKMRLKRDANGNYSYQFVADEEAMSKAEQELADAQNNLYNFDKSAYQKNLDDMYSTVQNYLKDISEAHKKYGKDKTKLDKEIAMIEKAYGEEITALAEKNGDLRKYIVLDVANYSKEMFDISKQDFLNMTEAEKNALIGDSGLVAGWKGGVQEMIDAFCSDDGASFKSMTQETLRNLASETEDFIEALRDVEDTALEAGEGILEEGQEIESLAEQMIGTMQQQNEAVQQTLENVMRLIDAFKSAQQAAIEAARAAHDLMMSQPVPHDNGSSNNNSNNNNHGPTEEPDIIGGSDSPFYPSGGKNNSSHGHGGFDLGVNPNDGLNPPAPPPPPPLGIDPNEGFRKPKKYQMVTLNTEQVYHTPNGMPNYNRNVTTNEWTGKRVKIENIEPGLYPYEISLGGKILGYVDKNMIYGYNTGGYTGAWGSEGRLAFLHQKELVLNQSDTENILNAVSAMRSIIDSVGENALARLANINQPNPSFVNNSADQMINQDVNITATFEGKTDAQEIQIALNNLINMAAQRANTRER